MSKDYLEEVKGKKIAITCIFSNVSYKKNNHRGLEIFYIRQILLAAGAEVDIVASKGRNSKNLDFYKNYTDSDFSEYDIVLIQLSPANFFGGVIGKHTETIIRNIAKFKNKENIHIFAQDPRIKPHNPAEVVNKRFGLCEDVIEDWKDLYSKCWYLFPGKDINRFYGMELNQNVFDIDIFQHVFRHHIFGNDNFDLDTPCDIQNEDKEYDLIFFGDKRAGFREKQLRKYFPTDTINLKIGYKSDKVPGSFVKKMPQELMMKELDKCRVSLVTADEEHMDNVVTFRFYEVLASNCLAAIQIEFDPEKKLIQDPVLRDLLYVSSQEDIKKLIESYSPELIDRQKKELKRIFSVREYSLFRIFSV